jgi:hypothetical protein
MIHNICGTLDTLIVRGEKTPSDWMIFLDNPENTDTIHTSGFELWHTHEEI